MPDEFTTDDKRRILLELRFIYREAELCQKWNLSQAKLRQWKKEANYAYLSPNLREMVVLALHNGTGDIAAMIQYLDYLDHTVYTEAEIEAVLHGLQHEGIAQAEGGRWLYNTAHSQNGTSFIF